MKTKFHQTPTYKFKKPEKAMLQQLDQSIKKLTSEAKYVATREYSEAESAPAGTLTPRHIRLMVKEAIQQLDLDAARAKALEGYVVNNIRLNGVPFVLWEIDPSIIKLTDREES